MKIRIPYGKGFLETTISDKRIAGIITSNLDRYETEESENEIIKKATSIWMLQTGKISKR